MVEAEFMGIVIACMEATRHQPEFILSVRREFDRIGGAHPDLVKRYWDAFGRRNAGEMERLLISCQKLMDAEQDAPWIGNLRINAVTGRFHVGNGHRSAPLFPAEVRYH